MRNKIFISLIALLIACLPATELAADEMADFVKSIRKFEAGQYQEALDIVNEGIKKYGESVRWVTGKFYILKAQGKTQQALDVGIKREAMATRKVPYKSLELAHLGIELKQKEVALDWVEEAVNRGYIRYAELQNNPRYRFIHQEPRFFATIEKIKTGIGIGQAAKPVIYYSTEMKDGKEIKKEIFNLSSLKGKVVLVNFWARWEAKCIKQIPLLKKLYTDYNEKGFELVGINLDNEKEALEKMEKQEQFPWQNLFSGKGFNDEVCISYGVRSLPSGWLFDKKGILRHFGLSGKDLETAITKLLAE